MHAGREKLLGSRAWHEPVLLTVDYRGAGRFGSDYVHLLEMGDALSAHRIDVEYVNVNQPLDAWLAHRPDSWLWCLAHDFAPGTANARRFPGRFAVRRALDQAKRLYVGNGYEAFTRSSSADKVAARRLLSPAVQLPRACVVRQSEGIPRAAARLRRTLSFPVVVKRTRDTGGSIGVYLARDDGELVRAMEEGFADYGVELLVEQFVVGTELTAWVFDSARGPFVYGVLEIVKPPDRPIFTHASKRMARPGRHRRLRPGAWPVVTPPQIGSRALARVRQAAVHAHQALGLRHYSRVDIILEQGVPYVLEVNGAPLLMSGGLGLVAAVRGRSYGQALVSILEGARRAARAGKNAT